MRLLPSSKLGLGSEWICHQLPDKANGSRVVTVRVVWGVFQIGDIPVLASCLVNRRWSDRCRKLHQCLLF